MAILSERLHVVVDTSGGQLAISLYLLENSHSLGQWEDCCIKMSDPQHLQ